MHARGNRRQEIFTCERDYRMYLTLVARTVKRYGWRCYAFCLMPNHIHLVVECENEALSSGMQDLQGTYARWFNKEHGVDGHLFQDRFSSWLVDNDGHWIELPRYVVLNPVRAGLCDDPEEWDWSSFNATAGTAPVPVFLSVDRILGELSPDETEAQRVYAAYVRDGIGACPGTGTGLRRVRRGPRRGGSRPLASPP